ncbi:origin recognition complex subunit 1 [Discoglossus pictus]
MTKYCTRGVRRRRIYIWSGKPVLKDRKVLSFQYGGLIMRAVNSEDVHITPGDFILIEGDDEERPFVARLLGLYDDGTDKDASKHAVVQWFVRYEEVPFRKRKLLGREPHQQEIFFYDVTSCENDIDAETIIGTVQVKPLNVDDEFPLQGKAANTLFVKLSWNGKTFNPLASNIIQERRSNQGSNGLVHHSSLPKPIFHAQQGDPAETRQSARSASKAQRNETEIESRHSASKCSHSKGRRDLKLSSESSTPSARKKLQLSSSPKRIVNPSSNQEDLLDQLLDEDFKTLEQTAPKRKVAFCGLIDSPPKKALGELEESMGLQAVSLKPVSEGLATRNSLRLTPSRRTLQFADGASTGDPRTERPLSKSTDEGERPTRSKAKTPQKQEATPKRMVPPSSKRSQDESDGMTPRSRRRSAQISAKKTQKLLKELKDRDLSDDDEDIFIPTKDASVFSSSSEGESEEEEEPQKKAGKKAGAIPRTPTSSRASSTRTPIRTPTCRTPHPATPRMPERSQPVKKPGSVLEEARVRLHVSAVPESLPCREQEFQDVYNFVESKLLDGTGGCMYISGVPGTGKTATVHEVIRCLERAVEEEELPSFQYIEINGMKLTDPHQAFVQILKLLTGQKATADHAATLLEKRFSTPASKRETTVLLVDELDLLWTRKQNVMYSLFDWPSRKQAKLIVLAIANTMDLPERIMMNRVASRLGLTRMSFQPYTHKQLQQIITSRLNHVKAFEEDAIQLVSRKVAALSGDARRCLDICRRATEICEFSGKKGESGLVKMPHVMEALDEMFCSPYVIAIRNAAVLEQAFLRAVIAEFRRSGLEEATFQQVYRQHIALCRIEGLQPPSMSDTMAVCLRLGASRLLLVESSRNDLHLRVRINVSQDDIMYALKAD